MRPGLRRPFAATATVAGAILLAWMAPLRAQSSAANHPDVLAAQRLFSAWMDGQVVSRGLPGIVVGVIADQELIWSAGFGHADIAAKRPMRRDTKFRMASHSKLFAATAIMQLREQGKLQLDDPVVKYLPWFKVKPAEPDDPPITIEELLTHSSGLPREAGDHWTTFEFPTIDQVRALIGDRQAAFPPETRWKYSNLAYAVAGYVVEAITGQSWSDYIQQNVFDPLGMTSSSVDKNVAGLATGYGPRLPDGSRATAPFIDSRGMPAATGITSTVEDMARFVSAQFRRGPRGADRILSTASLREMHRVRMLETNWTSGTGVGFAVNRVGDKIYVGHGGGYPGYTTQTLIQLDSKVGVVVLTNTNDSNPSDIARQLMRTVGEAVAKATAPPPKKFAWDPSWSRFVGLYQNRGSVSQVVQLNDRLVIINPYGPNVDNPTVLEPIGNDQFRFVAATGGGPVGEVVRFVEEGGRVVRMITGDSFVNRVH